MVIVRAARWCLAKTSRPKWRRPNGESGRQPFIVRRVGSNSSAFVRVLPPPRQVRESKAYADLVLSLQPVVYYRMERPKDVKDRYVLFDSAPGGHHGVLHFSDEYVGEPYVSGRFGQALRLRGPMVGDYAIVSDYPKTTDNRLTVSAWVMAMGRTYQGTIVANWQPFPSATNARHGAIPFDPLQRGR